MSFTSNAIAGILPMLLPSISSGLKEMLYEQVRKLHEYTSQTEAKWDDPLGDLLMKAAEAGSEVQQKAQEIIEPILMILWEKAKSTETPADNMAISLVAMILGLKLQG